MGFPNVSADVGLIKAVELGVACWSVRFGRNSDDMQLTVEIDAEPVNVAVPRFGPCPVGGVHAVLHVGEQGQVCGSLMQELG